MDQQEDEWAGDLEVEHVGRMSVPVQLAQIRERVQALQREIAKLRTANQVYLNKRFPAPYEIHAQRQRELRLQQIVDELSPLTKTKIL
jgi:hypothetical protein